MENNLIADRLKTGKYALLIKTGFYWNYIWFQYRYCVDGRIESKPCDVRDLQGWETISSLRGIVHPDF